jgi:subtilisin-like proprotein convertase family protein
MKLPVLTAAAALMAAGSARAAAFSYSASSLAPGIIPDGDPSGYASSVNVTAPAGAKVLSLEITIDLTATSDSFAFLGDLYVYATNGTHLAVLMNRAGRRPGSNAGYADDQAMQVTFSALGVSDFHDYRVALYGSHTSPLTGPLTGTWQPDARFIDPAAVQSADARLAGLSVFNGDEAGGAWHLFAADLSTGAEHQINAWTITISAEVIPEPGAAALLILATLAAARRRRAV